MKLNYRTIDFVIKDSYSRKMFVMALEYAMQLSKNENIINKPLLKLQICSLSKKLMIPIIFNIGFLRTFTIKLKISYMAAIQGISILELFVNSIIKVFWIRNISEDLSILEKFDEKEIKEETKLKLTPLMIISSVYTINNKSASAENK